MNVSDLTERSQDVASYLKVLATLGPLAPLDLLVADIETLPLDLVALERGYITL